MVNVEELLLEALGQQGKQYIFGREVLFSDADPAAFDCSELIEWACRRKGVYMPDGSWYQWRFCSVKRVSIETAINTRGALLFRFVGDPDVGGRPASAHVAWSLGNGTTIEARGSRWGVGVFTALNRGWTHAALIPGVDHTPTPVKVPVITTQQVPLVLVNSEGEELMAEKTALVELFHKGLGLYRGEYDPGFGRDPIIKGVVQHGPEPEADGWWGEEMLSSLRAQPRGGKVVMTAARSPFVDVERCAPSVKVWVTVA